MASYISNFLHTEKHNFFLFVLLTIVYVASVYVTLKINLAKSLIGKIVTDITDVYMSHGT